MTTDDEIQARLETLDRLRQESLELNDHLRAASNSAAKLLTCAKTHALPAARQNAARLLFNLARDLGSELRDLYESEPDWFDRLAEKNTGAPWFIRESDTKDREIRKWLGVISMGKELPPKTRRFKKEESDTKPFQRVATATFRLVDRHRKSGILPADVIQDEAGRLCEVHFDWRAAISRYAKENLIQSEDRSVPEEIEEDLKAIIATEGWRAAARFLPDPRDLPSAARRRSSIEFKMWFQVCWTAYMGSRSRMERMLPAAISEFEEGKKRLAKQKTENLSPGHRGFSNLERTRFADGLISAISTSR
jgi:hypothetical protein